MNYSVYSILFCIICILKNVANSKLSLINLINNIQCVVCEIRTELGCRVPAKKVNTVQNLKDFSYNVKPTF